MTYHSDEPQSREELLGSLGPIQSWAILYEVCGHIARSEGVSSPDDVTQDVLASMVASHITPGMLLSPTAYLRRCVRRWAARAGQRDARARSLAHLLPVPGSEATPEDEALAAELGRTIGDDPRLGTGPRRARYRARQTARSKIDRM